MRRSLIIHRQNLHTTRAKRLIALFLLWTLAGCGSSPDDLSPSGQAAPPVPFRVKADPAHSAIISLNSEIKMPDGRLVSLRPVTEDEVLSLQMPANSAESPLFRIASQGTWTRIFSRWSLEPGAEPTHQVATPTEPVAAQVTDKAIYFRTRQFDVPSGDGTYTYTVRWQNDKGASVTYNDIYEVSGSNLKVNSTVNDGPSFVSYTGSKAAYDTSAVISGLALAGNAWEPPGWPTSVPEWNQQMPRLTPLTDDELEPFVGRWTLSQNLNGVTGDIGEFDLRMVTLKNAQISPPHLNPSIPAEDPGGSSTLTCDIVTWPGPTEAFPQGWRPQSPVDWKVWITDANSQPIRTLTGQAVVAPPDANGKIGTIQVSWHGEREDGSIAPKGTYPFRIRAMAGLSTLGNTLTRPASGTFKIGNQELTVNATVDPEAFKPETGDTARLSFDLTAKDLGPSPEFDWTVSIESTESGSPLHTFGVKPGSVVNNGTSVHVDLTWDGKHNGNPVVPEFTWVIQASAKQAGGSDTASGEARIVNEANPLTVVEIKADAAVPYQDENGQAVTDPTFYYSLENPSLAHQLVLAADPEVTAGAGIAAKAGPFLKNLQMTLQRSSPVGQARFDVRVVDPDKPEEALTAIASLDFADGQTIATAGLTVNRLNKVHKYPYLKVQVRQGGNWKTTIQRGKKHPVYYSPFGSPKQPFENGEILSQAALDLAWEIEEGAQTADGVRFRASARLAAWLPAKNFAYTVSKGHTRYEKGSPRSRQSFNFKDFIVPLSSGGDFEGDCHDVASLEVMCCAAVGVDQYLFDFRPGPGQQSNTPLSHMVTNPLYINAAFVPTINQSAEEVGSERNQPSYRVYPFGDHQIAFWNNTAWSSLAMIQDAAPDFGYDGKGINEYLDRFLSNRQLENDGSPFSVLTPSRWVTFGNPNPYPDPRTGQEPIQLTGIVQ